MSGTEKRRKLNTERMHEKLKGDEFPEDTEEFLEEDIYDYFDILLKAKGMKKSAVIRRANLSRVYGYQLMEGRRRGKRDYYLLIALALGLNLTETQRMLSVVRCGALHPLIKRDAAVIFAVNHGYDVFDTYEFMCSLGLDPLHDGTEAE
ncbi:hypothetical protein EII15_22095 [Bacillus licheniformis]|nr:hypothetical protein EII15_22095 [Bacillus licheniformis]